MSIKEMQVVQELEFFELHAFSPSAATVTAITMTSIFVSVCRIFWKIFQNISSMQKTSFYVTIKYYFKAHFKHVLKVLFTVAVRSYK